MKLIFDIVFSGDTAAGLRAYTEVIEISVYSGDLPDNFINDTVAYLGEIYDGANVQFRDYTFLKPAGQLLISLGWTKNNDMFYSIYMDADIYLCTNGEWEYSVGTSEPEKGIGLDSLKEMLVRRVSG